MESLWNRLIPLGRQDGGGDLRYILSMPGAPAGPHRRKKMIRRSLFALAASLMALGTFASTVAVVTASSSTSSQIA